MNRKLGDHALVLGGSMAGLLTARVLAESFDRVTVVDRDTMPQIGEHRRGVPHGRHAHVLLTRGQRILEELFPGLTGDLIHQGAPAGDLLGDARWCLNGHRLRQADTGLTMLCASRPLLEGSVRSRVLTLPGVTLLDGCDIAGLATTADHKRVTGARVVRRADGESAELVAADLVVDATGRGSRTPRWLEELGYQAADVEQVRVGMGYSTRTYRMSRDAGNGDLLIANGASTGNPRGGVLICLEGDRAIVTLAGRLGDDPSTDADGFLAFARSLQFPDIYDRIRAAQPLDDPVGFRFPASVRHRYEWLRCFPACW
jgi:2-polyprenyl-6-methoxyphenol hydroxylase-like FAD-dependent oxidoreductase